VATLSDRLPTLRALLVEHGEPARAEEQSAYLGHRFDFLGVTAPERRRLQRAAWAGVEPPDGDELIGHARSCWDEASRELQYAGADALRRWEAALDPRHLDDLRHLVTHRSWWDTVDDLATHAVGGLVHRHRELQAVLDGWVHDPDPWVARTAVLHQLLWKGDTDAERLFAYVSARGADPDRFLRTACGWALRQYARTDPDVVWRFVDTAGDRLAPLTRREAEKRR
jgi:3-methyladenine DNA glycosylase AlkD